MRCCCVLFCVCAILFRTHHDQLAGSLLLDGQEMETRTETRGTIVGAKHSWYDLSKFALFAGESSRVFSSAISVFFVLLNSARVRSFVRSFVVVIRLAEIDMQERKTEAEIKKLAAKKDMGSAKVLARELVKSRKAKQRLYQSKANLSGIEMQLTQQASMIKLQKTMGKSAKIMGMMNQVVKLPQLNKVMMAMSREMEKVSELVFTLNILEKTNLALFFVVRISCVSRGALKAGLIEEMMDDTLADEELSEEADEQLDMGKTNTKRVS